MTVPMVDLRAQYLRIQEAVDTAIARVVASTQFIAGEDCRLFEQEFAAFCGARHAVGVANGTDALALALRAYGVGPGDEVVTVANTFIATGEAILLNGARPVFVDVDEASFTMDPERLEAALTKRTKVILPVHLYGHPAPMNEILAVADRHGLPVLEDAAQAHGAEIAGTAGGQPRARRVLQLLPGQEPRRLRRRGHGRHRATPTSPPACGSSPTTARARPGTTTWCRERTAASTRCRRRCSAPSSRTSRAGRRSGASARRRTRGFSRACRASSCRGSRPGGARPGTSTRCGLANRDALQAHLTARGIATAVHYPRPIHLQPAMAAAGGRPGDLPVSERLSQEVIQVPLYPELPFESLERIAQEIRAFCGAR